MPFVEVVHPMKHPLPPRVLRRFYPATASTTWVAGALSMDPRTKKERVMDELKLLAALDKLIGRIAKSDDANETNALAEAHMRLSQSYVNVKSAQSAS